MKESGLIKYDMSGYVMMLIKSIEGMLNLKEVQLTRLLDLKFQEELMNLH